MADLPASEAFAGVRRSLDCCDGLLWIGETYRWVSCGGGQSCAIPFRPVKDDHCFVHEAERRGISRKVASAPGWAVPGLTRVFLAHRADQKHSHFGRIFGYFVLHRVERLTAASVVPVPQKEVKARGLESRDNGMLDATVLSAETGKPVFPAFLTFTATSADPGHKVEFKTKDGRCRTEIEAGAYDVEVLAEGFEPQSFPGVIINRGKTRKQDLNLRPEEPEPVDGPKVRERTKECSDGTVIVTHIWKDGRWERTDEKCPDDGEPQECTDGEIRLAFCPDAGVIVAEVCIDGEWHETGAECAKNMPVHDEVLAEERSCSLRLRPGSVYLVDSLAAEIHDAFAASLGGDAHGALTPELFSTSLRDQYRRAVGDAERGTSAKDGRAHFNKIVERVLDWRQTSGTGPTVPPELVGKAEVKGDLVLFKEPPIFERRPRVSSRSLLQVAGDCLIDDIANGAPRVAIPTCVGTGKGKSVTKGEIVALMSAMTNVNKATVSLLLQSLADLAVQELGRKGERTFRLPGFGTFRWKRAKGQPPSVVFHMAKAMKELKHPGES